jgi:hypothetical protein
MRKMVLGPPTTFPMSERRKLWPSYAWGVSDSEYLRVSTKLGSRDDRHAALRELMLLNASRVNLSLLPKFQDLAAPGFVEHRRQQLHEENRTLCIPKL